jgi:hypothetical protein
MMHFVCNIVCAFSIFLVFSATVYADEFSKYKVVYEGEEGTGKGKHIVYIASDHEYRGEEALPALARIMAKRFGFKCTVLFGLNPKDDTLLAGSSDIKGLHILEDADLMVLAMRFINLEDNEMQHFVNYVNRGGPIMGLRTSTHAFRIPKERKFYLYDFRYPGEEFHMGFGRQVLGETWVNHYGKNHVQSSILMPEQENKDHPVLIGVGAMHTQAGGYTAYPIEGSKVLARGIILNGMNKDASIDTSKELMPVVWARDYTSKSSKVARILTTTQGASEDIIDENFRRLLINGHFWCMGLEEYINEEIRIKFIGAYNPSKFAFEGHRRGVKPSDLAGWWSPIMDPNAPVTDK